MENGIGQTPAATHSFGPSSDQRCEIPPELDRWNWGAFLLAWIWGLGNNTPVALWVFVPFLNLVLLFELGAQGSKWAWRNRAWRNAEHFRSTQRNWALAGAATWIGFLALILGPRRSTWQTCAPRRPFRWRWK
ncbi:MAG: hypothetical protein FWD68_14765 [Alphaproteobacteria bacterium]|nr:hypothetical protein [Alphaproteobacteria bacterium]